MTDAGSLRSARASCGQQELYPCCHVLRPVRGRPGLARNFRVSSLQGVSVKISSQVLSSRSLQARPGQVQCFAQADKLEEREADDQLLARGSFADSFTLGELLGIGSFGKVRCLSRSCLFNSRILAPYTKYLLLSCNAHVVVGLLDSPQ